MYEALATYYDKFMRDVPYGEWAKYADSFVSGLKKGHDAGAGTGRFTVELYRLGHEMTASDPSPAMLNLAAANAREAGADIRFVCRPAEELASPSPLGFVTACCDVVNYMRRPSVFFARAHAALMPGGVLAFDVSSEYKLRRVIGNNVFTDEADGVRYIWENALCRDRVDMKLTFFAPDGTGRYVASVDFQTQYIHANEFIKSELARAGFGKIKVRRFLSGRAPGEKDERIYFVAYKER